MKFTQLLSLAGIYLQLSGVIAGGYYNGKYYGYYDGNVTFSEYYTGSGVSYKTYKGDYSDDNIKYWTEYAIQAKKCITYNHKDMIVFSVYEKYYNHCKDKPIGTYMTDVPTFVSAWVEQQEQNAEDKYDDDFVAPDLTYVSCYPYETNNGVVSSIRGQSTGGFISLCEIMDLIHIRFFSQQCYFVSFVYTIQNPTVLCTIRMYRWRQSIPLRQRLQRQHMRNP